MKKNNSYKCFFPDQFCVKGGKGEEEIELKRRHRQKILRLRHTLNLHAKFQLLSLSWRVVTRAENSKNKKNQRKDNIFRALRGHNETEKSKLPKCASRTLTKYTYQILTGTNPKHNKTRLKNHI